MWAEKGGLDFEGRAKWDAWTNVKVGQGEGAVCPLRPVILAGYVRIEIERMLNSTGL
jgi:hypothetical protein